MNKITTDERFGPNQTKKSDRNPTAHNQTMINSELIEIIPNDQTDSQAEDDELKNLELHPDHIKRFKGYSWKYTCGFIIYVLLSMTVGIIIVSLTGSRKTNPICVSSFEEMVQNEKTFDSSPRHLSIGHLNNDQNEDMAIVNTAIDCISIRFGLGNGSFGNQIIYSTGNGSQPYWVNVAHLNNDNHSDIIVANYGTNSIGVFLGNKDAKFDHYQTYSLGSCRPVSFSIGHLNNDEELDIGLICNGTFDLIVLFGKEDGSFHIGSTYFLGFDSMPRSILLNDLNGDRQADLIILNSGTNEFLLFLSNSNGTFDLHSYPTEMNSHPSSMTLNHFNSDLYLDLVILNSLSKNLLIFYGNSSGQFQTKGRSISIKSSDLKYIVSGHFTNDEIVDLAMIDSKENSVMIYRGNEDGDLTMIGEQSTGFGSEPCFILVNDLNKDNQSDLIIVNHGNNYILLLNSFYFQTTSEQTTYSTDSNSYPLFVNLVDVNNDSYVDILVANYYRSNIGVFIGFGNGSFKDQENIEVNEYPISFATGDLNKDGKVDIAVLTFDVDEINLYFGEGNGSFSYATSVELEEFSGPNSIVISDFNKDNNVDIATANLNSDTIGVFFGNEDGRSFRETYHKLTKNDSSPTYLTIGDLNKDGFIDIISANEPSGTLTILFGMVNGNFQNATSINLDYYYPSWIIIADMNNDEKQDIILSSTSNNIVVVLLGNGKGEFSSLYAYSADSESVLWGHAIGQFNKDNILDIAVADPVESSVTIFLRNSNQSLIARKSIPVDNGYIPFCIATGDLNNDNETDIVVGNVDSDGITVLLMKYQAIFANETSYNQKSGEHPNSITAADLNNDQQMDLIVAQSGKNSIELLMNYHNGQFEKKIDYFTGENSYPRSILTADFDRNNLTDIAIVNARTNILLILLNPNDLNRSFEYPIGPGSFPNSIAIDDLNEDGWMDIVITNFNKDNIVISFGFHYPTFVISETADVPRGYGPENIFIVDLNGDSISDLIVNFRTLGIGIFFRQTDGTLIFHDFLVTNTNLTIIKFTVGDFNNDHRLDIAVTSSDEHTLDIYLNDQNGTFSKAINHTTHPYSPQFITFADFNRDGQQDFVVANKENDCIGIFLRNSDGSLAEQVPYQMPEESAPVWIVTDDLNNDNISDLTVANLNGGNIRIYFGVGDGTFNNFTTYTTGNKSSPSSLAIEDFDKDNCVDIAVLNSGSKNIAIFYGFGNGTFSSPIKYSMKQNSILTSMIAQDLNNDSILDIAVTNFVDGNANVGVFYGLGRRRFLPAKMYSTRQTAQAASMLVNDIDNDGQLDFIVSISKKDKIVTMSINKNEPFGPFSTIYTGLSSRPSAVAISHLNNDHKLDIAVVNSGTNDVLILFGDGNGNFIQGKRYSTGDNTLPNSIAVKDMDNDQRNDIVVTNSKKDEIGIFYNDGNGSFALVRPYSTGYGSEPSFVSVGDLDKDNFMDIVVANTGINTVLILYGSGNRIFAKKEIYSFNYDSRPKSVVIADVNNDGWLDIGVAHYESGVVHVLLHTCQLGQPTV